MGSEPSYEEEMKFQYQYKISYYNYYKQLQIQNLNNSQPMDQMPAPVINYTPETNYILCEMHISETEKKKMIRIINSYDNYCKNNDFEIIDDLRNEEQIINCRIYINGKEKKFSYHYSFPSKGNYKIKFVFNKPLTNCSYMFYEIYYKNIDLSNFNTNYVTDMSYMFYGCSVAESINLTNFNTQNVHDMSYMFYNCSGVYKLDLSSFNAQNVINMTRMFSNCSKLSNLILSNFNAYNVRYMAYMFYNDFGLHNLDLSNFDTQNAVDMKGMFEECISLENLNLLNFTINSSACIDNMFKSCNAFENKTIITRDPTILSLMGK